MAPRVVGPDHISAELGQYLLSIHERALEVGQHQAFADAMISVLVHSLREGYDDDIVKIDANIDRIAANMKEAARNAIRMQSDIDMPTQGNA